VRKISSLYIGFILILALGILHIIGSYLYFYWIFWWFDFIMHFLAGLGGGFVAIWFFFESGLLGSIEKSSRRFYIVSVLAVGVVGVAWEIFEYLSHLTEALESYKLDLANDLLMDLMGAILASAIASRYWLGESLNKRGLDEEAA
jgi:hypothetical protein